MPVCPDDCGALIEVRNVDGFSLVSRGAGGLYGTNYSNKGGTPPGTHKAPRRPTALAVDNSTNLHMENFFMAHQVGVAFWHNVQNVSIINCSIDNRDKPVEERSEPHLLSKPHRAVSDRTCLLFVCQRRPRDWRNREPRGAVEQPTAIRAEAAAHEQRDHPRLHLLRRG